MKIINIIETYGETVGRAKQLEYLVDDTYIAICYSRKIITISTTNNNIKEEIFIRNKNDLIISSQKCEDDVTIEKVDGNFKEIQESHPEIIQKANEYLSLVYQEIE